MNPGGKGANQAVAAARLGPDVAFVAKLGNDIFGRQALQQFKRESIDTRFITVDPDNASGVALINVDARGNNCISVAPGANWQLKPADVEKALAEADNNTIVLLQMEMPLPTLEYVIRESHAKGLLVMLNPAPVQILPPDIYPLLYLITPNDTEAELLTGIRVTDADSALDAALKLQEMGVTNVIITLGEKGAFLKTETASWLISAPVVEAIDTTAAGNCFNGALAVALADRLPLEEAVEFACKAASISVTRMGAQSSLPSRKEVDAAPALEKKKLS